MLLTKLITNAIHLRIVSFRKLSTNLNFIENMNEVNGVGKRLKYDGRSKKRKWEERRSDYAPDAKRTTEDVEKIRRRKYAILMAYSGVNFFGMQRNPNLVTIEEEFFKALHACDYINAEGYQHVQTIQFQRAARTDKGVSAARQIVSIKLPENTEIAKINERLPEAIRLFGLRRVTKGFNSKTQCDARTYFYMLPTVAFANYKDEVEQDIFRLSDETFDRVNTLLTKYVGTKNFHNFTIKKKFQDPSASRYIMSFICEKPFLSNGVEFAVLKVKGQSFMMHQIRKMVGLILAIVRGHTNEELFDKTFLSERVNVPKAPGLGLVLDFVHYERYAKRYGTDHDTLEWKEEDQAINEFKEKYIYPTIVDTEIKEQSMVQWLEVLLKHSYDIIDEEAENEEAVDDDGEVDCNDDGETPVKEEAVDANGEVDFKKDGETNVKEEEIETNDKDKIVDKNPI